jgi:hypothetical protein
VNPKKQAICCVLREFRAPELFTRAPYRLQSVMSGFLPFFLFALPQTINADIPCHCSAIVASISPRSLLSEFYNPSEFAESEFAEQMHESECREALGTSDTCPNSSAHA